MSKQSQIVAQTSQYLIPNYGRLGLAMERGAGARLWDADGKEYLDFFAGFGGAGVSGHAHPKITQALCDQAARLTVHGNLFTNAPQVELAKRITDHAFGGKVFFCHSGAEANEAALKLVRLAAGPGRYKIISFDNCFHGRTMGSLSLTPAKFQKGFEPMLEGNIALPMGDLDLVARSIDAQTAGIFIEPIQSEGGVYLPTPEFMTGLRRLCDQHKLLLVCDEVWTAPARSGKWFAYQYYDITPDVMTLAKAIGGGTPVGVMVAAPKWQDLLQPGTHGCTMGGNPLCAAAGVAAMKLIEDEDLVGRAAAKGQWMMKTVRDARLPVVKDVRGRGMLIGIELAGPGAGVFKSCMEKGLLINCTQDRILRLAPPLVTEDALLEKGLGILMEVLRAL